MLPGFYIPLRERKPRSAQQVFADKIASLKRILNKSEKFSTGLSPKSTLNLNFQET